MTRAAIAQRDLPAILARLDPESRLLALVIVEAGPRLAEALAMRAEDIGEIDGRESVEVRIHGVKGGGERVSFLTREVAQRIRSSAAVVQGQRGREDNEITQDQSTQGPEFARQVHESLLFPRSRRHYQRAFQRAGFDARSLRHTFFTSFLDNGGDLISAMMLGGHKKADSTRRYWDFTEERLYVLARSVAVSLPRARRRAHRFVDLRDGRLDP
jgi:integrase